MIYPGYVYPHGAACSYKYCMTKAEYCKNLLNFIKYLLKNGFKIDPIPYGIYIHCSAYSKL